MTKGDAVSDKSGLEFDEGSPVGFEPSYATLIPIPHYYGSFARELLLAASALLLISSPLYADMLKIEFPFEVLAVVCAVGFAGFTSPRNRWAVMGDAVIAGVGMVVYAGWALMGYETVNAVAFVLRIAIALICLFAFYFSIKTVRAMAEHKIVLPEDERAGRHLGEE